MGRRHDVCVRFFRVFCTLRLSSVLLKLLAAVLCAMFSFFCRITAQLIGPRTKEPFLLDHPLQDRDLVEGPNRSQYASFTWTDLSAIAPWLEIPKKIDGPGLGND